MRNMRPTETSIQLLPHMWQITLNSVLFAAARRTVACTALCLPSSMASSLTVIHMASRVPKTHCMSTRTEKTHCTSLPSNCSPLMSPFGQTSPTATSLHLSCPTFCISSTRACSRDTYCCGVHQLWARTNLTTTSVQ